MEGMGLMSPSSPEELVSSIIRSYGQLQTSRYTAIASITLLVYDWLIALDKEVKFIWGRRWTFARIVYHLNRVLPLLLFSVILMPNILFAPSYYTATMSAPKFLIMKSQKIMLQQVQTNNSILQLWCSSAISAVVHNFDYSVLGAIWPTAGLGLDGSCGEANFNYHPEWLTKTGQALDSRSFPDGRARPGSDHTSYWKYLLLGQSPPGVLEGCFVVLPSNIWLAYLSGVLYESLVFGLLVWRIWRLSSGVGLTPLMKQLLKHGASFFAVNFGLMLLSCVGSGYSETIILVNVSGILTALSSIMCSRIFFSMHQFACLGGVQVNACLPATEFSGSSASDRLNIAMESLGNDGSHTRISLGVPNNKCSDINSPTRTSWTRLPHKVPV
ncbi:F-box-like domain protein [Rhizoctonia solani]|uniref:F-box-like domain protein n=1 Tax=Rhizoctonia solani TaxID=456999 RepID=A0A8H8T1N4_9AGAM|nr:F-box-like domain protein [Rhizoctonia solani]QRW25539.1 F-box-like domain protein [Rhizoctonia solani]